MSKPTSVGHAAKALARSKCGECGGSSLSWDTHNVTFSGVQDGRLRTNEVTCMFVLGCDQCSATIARIRADTLAQHLSDQRTLPAARLPSVQAVGKYAGVLTPFVEMMARELHANSGKGDRPGWLAMSADTCLLEIFYHLGKLQKAVKNGDGASMQEFAADTANMCMMLLDICGALPVGEPPALAGQLPERDESLGTSEHDDYANGHRHGWNACHDAFMPHVARLQAEVERLCALHDVDTEAMRRMLARNAELEGLLRVTRQFIKNGIDLGYITMPDPETPDPAHDLLPAIEAALNKTERQCCTPTADERAILAAGDHTPEELWGGPRPTCPKCIKTEGQQS